MSFSTFILILASTPSFLGREIKIYNKCPNTTWAGILGPLSTEERGLRLNAGETRSIHVDDGWFAGRIWPQTECDNNMNCATGSTGPKENCYGVSGQPPVTLAEFTLRGAGGLDFYDVSLVDGYNIPVLIDVYGGEGACKRAGGCFKNINDFCPGDLAVKKDGRTVGCKSGCLAYNNDRECCRGAYGTPDKCRQSKTAMMFKDACPGAYSYAYDDTSSTFTCKGGSFVVQFC